MPYKYENGKWTWIPESSNPSSGSSSSSTSKPSTSTNKRPPTTSNIKDPGTLTDISDGSTTSTGSDATKDYVEHEYNMIEGDATVNPDPKLKAKKTVRLNGIGSQLSGLYYVEQVVHSFSSSGYTQTINVSRDGFGDKLKKGR